MCEKLYDTAKDEYESGDYDGAVKSLEKVVKMDEGYQDGRALLLLAQSFEKKGEQDKANIRYQKLVEEYKGKEAAATAQKALDSQNGQKGQQEGQEDEDTQEGRDAKEGQGDSEDTDNPDEQDGSDEQDDSGGPDDEETE